MIEACAASGTTIPALEMDRAVGDLRRGLPVILSTADRGAWLALNLDGVGEAALAGFLRQTSAPPVLAITGRRAAVLGLTECAERPAVVVTLGDQPSLAGLRALIDPLSPVRRTLTLADRQAGPPTVLEQAAIQLAKAARLLPAMILAPLAPAGRNQGWLTLSAAAVLADDGASSVRLTLISEAHLPMADAEDARMLAFRPADGGAEHLAIVVGTPQPGQPVLTRVHSSCLTGDLFGSLRCDCGDQLRGALAAISAAGAGVVLYLNQEGRGIGIANKLRAYRLQERGFDTIDANDQLGFEADERDYAIAAALLRQLGLGSVRLMTNNPEKVAALIRNGIQVTERVQHSFAANNHNRAYLATKATRAGHLL